MTTTVTKERYTAILKELDKTISKYHYKIDNLLPGEPRECITDNLAYLQDHGYVENQYADKSISPVARIIATRITAAGHDYISKDGGLTAEKFVNIKIHSETLSILLAAIDASKETPDIKSKIKDALLQSPKKIIDGIGTVGIAILIEYLKQHLGLPH